MRRAAEIAEHPHHKDCRMPTAQKYFLNQGALPTMPEVAHQLLRSFNDDNISLTHLAGVISKDATLAAKVLRLANSAHYRPAHDIATLADASSVLGLDTLRNLSMAACVVGAFPQARGLDRMQFWRHSLATAGYARALSRWLQLDSEVAYLAGLMLRTGQILMAMSEPGLVADEEAHITEAGCRLSLEIHRFGCTHSDVTAELARRWQFPALLVKAFADASDPVIARPFSPLAAVLRMAEVLADALDLGTPPMEALVVAEPALLDHMHIDRPWLADKLMALGDVTDGLAGMLVH
jgi:HD-like signal output (HDOD) protein